MPRLRVVAGLDRGHPAGDQPGDLLVPAVIEEPQITPGLAAGQKRAPRVHRRARAEQGLGGLFRSRDGHDLAHIAGLDHVHQGTAESELTDDGLHHELQGLPQVEAGGNAARQFRQQAGRLRSVRHGPPRFSIITRSI